MDGDFKNGDFSLKLTNFKPYTKEKAAEALREAGKNGTAQVKRAFMVKSPFLANGIGFCGIGYLVWNRVKDVFPKGRYFHINGGIAQRVVTFTYTDERNTPIQIDIRARDVFKCPQADYIWDGLAFGNDFDNKSFSELADRLER